MDRRRQARWLRRALPSRPRFVPVAALPLRQAALARESGHFLSWSAALVEFPPRLDRSMSSHALPWFAVRFAGQHRLTARHRFTAQHRSTARPRVTAQHIGQVVKMPTRAVGDRCSSTAHAPCKDAQYLATTDSSAASAEALLGRTETAARFQCRQNRSPENSKRQGAEKTLVIKARCAGDDDASSVRTHDIAAKTVRCVLSTFTERRRQRPAREQTRPSPIES